MSEDGLQKMLVEMQDQLNKQQSELNFSLKQISRLTQRNKEITREVKEVNESGKGVVWQSCGKAFVKVDQGKYVSSLKQEMADNLDMIKNLNKKKNYLDTSIEKTLENLKKYIQPQAV